MQDDHMLHVSFILSILFYFLDIGSGQANSHTLPLVSVTPVLSDDVGLNFLYLNIWIFLKYVSRNPKGYIVSNKVTNIPIQIYPIAIIIYDQLNNVRTNKMFKKFV